MKKVVLSIAVLVLVLLAGNTFAQSPSDALFTKYGSKDGFTTVHITKDLFALFADVAAESDSEETREMQDMIKGLDQIRILMYEKNDEGQFDGKLFQDFKSELSTVKLKDFTELMTVKETNESVKFMILKKDKIINEMFLIIDGKDQAGFISITGNIDMKSIANLSKAMNIKGMEKLEMINKKGEEKK